MKKPIFFAFLICSTSVFANIVVPQFRQPVDYLAEGTVNMQNIFNNVRQAGLQQQQINAMMQYRHQQMIIQAQLQRREEQIHRMQMRIMQEQLKQLKRQGK